MKANKSAGTKPELALRRALWQAGARGYRLHPKAVPGRPDVAFPGAKLAVFVHGCYWHQCPRCAGKKAYPRANQEFWRAKFAENATRDERVKTLLEKMGWQSLVVWECEVKENVGERAAQILAELGKKRR